MNSTPLTPASIMRLTALFPPPPTPMILTSVKPFAPAGPRDVIVKMCSTTGSVRGGCVSRSGSKPGRKLRHV